MMSMLRLKTHLNRLERISILYELQSHPFRHVFVAITLAVCRPKWPVT